MSTYAWKFYQSATQFGLNPVVTSTSPSDLYYNVKLYGVMKVNENDVYTPGNFGQSYAANKAEIDSLYIGRYKPIQNSPYTTESWLPAFCGFRYRKKGASAWITVTAVNVMNLPLSDYVTYIRPIRLDSGVLTAQDNGNGRELKFEYEILGLPAGESYEYQAWTKNRQGITYYAEYNLTNTPKGEAEANTKYFKTGDVVLPGFENPTYSTAGHWYQMFDGWIVNNDIVSKFAPTLSVRQDAAAGSQHFVYYYMNRKFESTKNYRFRIVTDGYYEGVWPDDGGVGWFLPPSDEYIPFTRDSISMITPWGESVVLDKPFVPHALNTIGMPYPKTDVTYNLYLHTNINAYTKTKLSPEKPASQIISSTNPQNPVSFLATNKLNKNSNFGLAYFGISENYWMIQGQATFTVNSQVTTGPVLPYDTEEVPYKDFLSGEYFAGKGWHYLSEENRFFWFDKVGFNNGFNFYGQLPFKYEINRNLPLGGNVNDYLTGKSVGIEYLLNNFIASFVTYQTFNLRFKYLNLSRFAITMYLGTELPYRKSTSEWYITNINDLISDGKVKKISTLSTNLANGVLHDVDFVGLEGNQYVFFVADPIIAFYDKDTMEPIKNNIDVDAKIFNTAPTNGYQFTNFQNGYGTYSMISISDVVFAAAYNENNNEVLNSLSNSTGSWFVNIANATYSMRLGNSNNVIPGSPKLETTVYAKAGNGSFNSGIWENGVWNDGWRDDYTIREFFRIDSFYATERDTFYRMKISGPPSSAQDFQIGDRVSISNVIAIDINLDRKLLKNYYTIVDRGTDYIEVSFEYFFQIMRLELDSNEHRILVSRNIWLRGVFFNGYFRGIWNDGIFSGYPLITKMDESHWIDGIFNGGHFTAKKRKVAFTGKEEEGFDKVPRLKLNFAEKHRLTKDDIISITFSSNTTTLVGTLGKTKVVDVPDETSIITELEWNPKMESIIEGTIYTVVSTGLIQNFDFYSNNASKKTSIETLLSDSVFSYNSWIDVNYSNQSAVNLGRPESFNEKLTDRPYSDNNLYGYPTYDVVTSRSVFRDSYSLNFRRYKLGFRYKIFNDFVGEAGGFEDYFESTDTAKGLDRFTKQGWSFATLPSSEIVINPTSLYYPVLSGGSGPLPDPDKLGPLILEFLNNPSVAQWKVGDVFEFTGPYMEFAQMFFDLTKTPPIQGKTRTDFKRYVLTKNFTILSITETVTGAGVKHVVNTGMTQSNEFVFLQVGSTLKKWGNLRARYEVHENAEYTYTSVSPGYYENWPAMVGYGPESFSIRLQAPSGLTFSRTNEPTTTQSKLVGKELKAEVSGSGGILNLIPADGVQDRKNGEAKKTMRELRYSMVEFDLLRVDSGSASTNYFVDERLGEIPPLHFNNLNFVTRERSYNGLTKTETTYASHLPIHKNVNHLNTFGSKKQEFFFNKRNLLMNFKGLDLYGQAKTDYYIDNLKMYELDMVPFFAYFTDRNINKSVQLPNTTSIYGLSPFIDYTQNELTNEDEVLSFFSKLVVDNITVTEAVNWIGEYTNVGLLPDIYKQNLNKILKAKTGDNTKGGEEEVDINDPTIIWEEDPNGTLDPNQPPGGGGGVGGDDIVYPVWWGQGNTQNKPWLNNQQGGITYNNG